VSEGSRHPDDPLPPELGHFFAGLCAGEACFAICWASGSRQRFRCDFVIRMREDEEPMLRELQRRIGVGTLRRHRARGRSHPIVQWRAGSAADCRRLVEIFDRFPLRSRKQRDYEIWREAVLELSRPERDPQRLARLKEELHAGGPPAPYVSSAVRSIRRLAGVLCRETLLQ